MSCSFKLEACTVLQVPLKSYPNNFTFIVNGEIFKTNKIVADLLSPVISKIHSNDPTFNEYTIVTKSNGDFNTILNLIKFDLKEIQETEIPYITEIIDQLQTTQISIDFPTVELTLDNVIDFIAHHEKSYFFKSKLETEINFVSNHFNELNSEQKKELHKLSSNTLELIINNKNLSLDSEDQLLTFINELYLEDVNNSNLYEYIIFQNVEKKSMKDFVECFNIENMTTGTWKSLSKCLLNETEEEFENKRRYGKKNNDKTSPKRNVLKEIPFSNDNLKGIFNYFRTQSNLDEEVKVTCSSRGGGDAKLLLDIENSINDFFTTNIENSWICFEFKKHKIIPTNYTIKSYKNGPGGNHPKSWKIEISDDGNTWTTVDEQSNCSFLNGSYLVHTFPINKQAFELKDEGVKYIRIYQTGPNWNSPVYHFLNFCSIEFYGEIL